MISAPIPAEVLAGLAEFVHLVTRLKLVPEAAQDASLTPDERGRGQQFSQALSMPVLTRAWQLLLKGLREVKDSPRPLAAADMVLVRLAFAADLPTPGRSVAQARPGPSCCRRKNAAAARCGLRRARRR